VSKYIPNASELQGSIQREQGDYFLLSAISPSISFSRIKAGIFITWYLQKASLADY